MSFYRNIVNKTVVFDEGLMEKKFFDVKYLQISRKSSDKVCLRIKYK